MAAMRKLSNVESLILKRKKRSLFTRKWIKHPNIIFSMNNYNEREMMAIVTHNNGANEDEQQS